MTTTSTPTAIETPEAILARGGCDKNGQPINAPKDEAYPGDEYRFRDHFGPQRDTLALDDEREEISNAIDANDFEHAMKIAETERNKHIASGDNVRALESAFELSKLQALHVLTKRNKARETLKVRDLSSNREFTAAVLTGDMPKAHDMMIAVVRNTEAPYALRVACVGAMIQIAPLVGTDDGANFNDAWLSRTTGMARSTCKELIDAHCLVGTDLAMLLLGTESEGRKGVREWGAMLPERQSEAVEGLKQYHTAAMIAHAGEGEDVARTRKIGLSEANVLDATGMNNPEGREQLVKMPIKKGQLWLATMLDETHEAAERTGGIVATAKGAADLKNGKLVKPLSPAVPTRRLLTQRQLNAENVREL